MLKIKNIIQKYRKLSIPAKASIAYTFANLVSKSINIITVPIFTRMMSTYEVGISTTYSSWYSILYAVVTLSLCSGSLNIAMMDYEKERDRYLSACLTLSTISGFIFIIFYFIFSKPFNQITALDSPVMCLLIISLVINPALDYWYAKQRYEYNYIPLAVVSILVSILSSVVAIISVCSLKNDNVVSLGNVKVISQGIVITIIALFFYINIMIKGKTYFDLTIWKYALKLSIPLIVHSLAKNILDVSDRLMISNICGKSDAGIYGTIYSLAMLELLIWNAINSSLIPITFEKVKQRKYKELDSMLVRILFWFGIITILLVLFAPEVLKIFTTNEYVNAVHLIPALSAGVYFTALYNIYGNLLLYRKKTINIMLATTLAAIANIILNYYFINKFGYIAAAYTTLISFIILALLQGIMVRVVYKEKVINDAIFLIISLVVAMLCNLCNLLYDHIVVRYGIILIILLVIAINRKKLLSIIKRK